MPTLAVAGERIAYTVRRSSRARRIRIVVGSAGVVLVVPKRASLRVAARFLESKASWIRAQVRAAADRRAHKMDRQPEWTDGGRVTFRDRRLRIHVRRRRGGRPSLRFASAFHVTLPVGLSPEAEERETQKTVEAWMSDLATRRARELAEEVAPTVGRRPMDVRVGRQRTLWGSCSKDGVIRLNLRLMAAPRAVFDYVVIHELCHLRHPHHGANFWRLVERLVPDYPTQRAWLREHDDRL